MTLSTTLLLWLRENADGQEMQNCVYDILCALNPPNGTNNTTQLYTQQYYNITLEEIDSLRQQTPSYLWMGHGIDTFFHSLYDCVPAVEPH